MIPDKNNALCVAHQLLNKGGILGIADFWRNSPQQSEFGFRSLWRCFDPFCVGWLQSIEAALHAAWFRQDGVHLLTLSMFDQFMRVEGERTQ